jgi:anti-sigma regulatory factor (Ser/Thr protein kinase)
MSEGQPDRAGLLMRGEWRVDAVVTRRIELRGGPAAPAEVRTRLGGLLGERLTDHDRIDVLVLVCELVTNAVRHGLAGEHDTVVVHVAVAAHVLRVEVCDQGPGFSPPTVPQARAGGGGNGLLLVDRLSSDWGVAVDDGTCVWFEREIEPAPG